MSVPRLISTPNDELTIAITIPVVATVDKVVFKGPHTLSFHFVSQKRMIGSHHLIKSPTQ